MTDNHIYSTEEIKQCQAITSKGRKCRNKAMLCRVYKGDLLEY